MKSILIMVTYNPDLDTLRNALSSISPQVTFTIIIDNTIGGFPELQKFEANNVKIIFFNDNMGIAYAQNIGIKMALKENVEYILLSDQDTLYPDDYVSNMVSSFDNLQKIAAVAPIFIDAVKNSNEGFIAISPFGFKRIFPKNGKHRIRQAISSGSVLNAKYLEDIGLMDEKLFIDWVDLEWCWRAGKKGYKIIGNADVEIHHQLGDTALSIGFREINLRSPIRHYYITRNAFHLAIRDRSLDLTHRIVLFLKSFRYIAGYPLFSKPHLLHLKYVLLGFWHGITGRLGRLK